MNRLYKHFNWIICALAAILLAAAIIGYSKNNGGSRTARVSFSKADPETDFEAIPNEDGKSVKITKYIGEKLEINIPSKIHGLPVTSIGGDAFINMNLISVTFPDTITFLGEDSFYQNKLTYIKLPDDLNTISFGTFEENPLTKITIGSDVNIMERYKAPAFDGDFAGFYNSNGKTAGTYIRSDSNSADWVKQ